MENGGRLVCRPRAEKGIRVNTPAAYEGNDDPITTIGRSRGTLGQECDVDGVVGIGQEPKERKISGADEDLPVVIGWGLPCRQLQAVVLAWVETEADPATVVSLLVVPLSAELDDGVSLVLRPPRRQDNAEPPVDVVLYRLVSGEPDSQCCVVEESTVPRIFWFADIR